MFKPALHWVRGLELYHLALMPRPFGGEWLIEEIESWRCAGITSVVSFLEWREMRDMELEQEEALCGMAGIRFRSFPIKDRGTPDSVPAVSALVTALAAELAAGEAVAIHCRGGIGRTGLIAGCLLHALGIPQQDILPMLSRARGVTVPDTPEQEEWLKHFVKTFSPISSSS
ncbi:MAG: tyrosine-protein phosphatase [Candidatus Competibacter denitrificans]|jgi:protein-tyrosine phosphatase